MIDDRQVQAFWEWLRANARSIASDPENSDLLAELDQRVDLLAPQLSWEIGPGASRPWQLVLSPNSDRNLREMARSIVSSAPDIDEWEFHSARQPKDWDFKFELMIGTDGSTALIDASDWTFLLLQYRDGMREVVLKANEIPIMTGEERRQACAIVLESVLGEEMMLDLIGEFELVNELEPSLAGKERPIQSLRSSFKF